MRAMTTWALRLMGWGIRLGLGLALLVALLPLLVWALAHNEWACQRMLAQVPGLQIEGQRGSVLGDFVADKMTLALPRGGRLTLISPSWQGLHLRLDPQAAWHVGVALGQLHVRRLDVRWVADPTDTKPLRAPVDLILPVSLEVGVLQVDEAHAPWWGEQPLTALSASLFLGASRQQHRVQLSHLAWSGWQLQGSATVGERAPLPVSLHLQADGQAQGVAQASAVLSAQGPLSDLLLDGHAQWRAAAPSELAIGTPAPAGAAASLALRAQVQAFAPWPLSQLHIKADALDLANAWPGLPQTHITGELSALPEGASGLSAKVQFNNAQAGAWDANRLPIRSLEGALHWPRARQLMAALTPQTAGADAWFQGASLRLTGSLPAMSASAPGTVTMTGTWGASHPIDITMSGLEPQALHAQAPPLRLTGKVTVLPRWADLPRAASVDWLAEVAANLQGLYVATATTTPVALVMQGKVGLHQAFVERLALSAGDASASLSKALVAWPQGQPWRAQGRADLAAFDPQVWLPWPSAVTGRNRLSGAVEGQIDGQWRGQLQAKLAPSLIAGLPVQGGLQWRSPKATSRMSVDMQLELAGNRLQAQADVPWGTGAQGQWQLRGPARWRGEVHAPALKALQAMAPLLGARQIQGTLEGRVQGAGQWPTLQTDGSLQATGLQWVPVGEGSGVVSLASLDARWQVDTRSAQTPVQMDVNLRQLQRGTLVLEQWQTQLQGSVGQHRLQVSGQGHKTASKDQAASEPLSLRVDLEGALTGNLADAAAPRRWRGQLHDMVLRSTGPSAKTILMAPASEVVWQQGGQAQGGELLQVMPTRLTVMGTELALEKMLWMWPDRTNDVLGTVDVDLRLLPLNVPKLLATWQPQAGWGGDMVVAGQVRLQHSLSKPWRVDARVSRESGDVSLSEPTIEGNSAQKLGISQATFALQARDGVWTLTEAFNGRLLGVVNGRQVVQARDKDQWPAGGDPLSGELDLQISSLRPWGAWMPAGWRVSGQLMAKAQLAGTLAAPEYRGEVHGEALGLGQALLGVNLTDGLLDASLQGPVAKLTRFTAKGANQGGQVSAQGEVSFGESPTATLQVQADRFALLQRVDRRVVISGQTQLSLGQDDMKADGQIRIDEGLIDISRFDAPTIGDDVNVLHRPGELDADANEAPEPPATKRKAHVNVAVDLGNALRLKGRGLDATLGGLLKLTTPNNKPALNGSIQVTRGTYAAYGQKLLIDRGSIAFTGSIENPRLDLLAMRAQSATASSSDVKVGVTITGTALDPRVRLYSEPSMSETEKLSWLVLGRAPTGLGGADLGLLQSAAVALLSGEGTSPTDNLIGMLGLDELSVKQTDGTVRDTVVNVGKQVSKYWYVGYERNLTATGGNWQMIYRLAQRFTLRAQAGVDNAVDFIWSWRWD